MAPAPPLLTASQTGLAEAFRYEVGAVLALLALDSGRRTALALAPLSFRFVLREPASGGDEVEEEIRVTVGLSGLVVETAALPSAPAGGAAGGG